MGRVHSIEREEAVGGGREGVEASSGEECEWTQSYSNCYNKCILKTFEQ